ncbi:MAG: family 10 glycosylhydrolase [Proteobacteria bacterium]|nr:family 10 glycosylhydrolase [Pseudomonadota bacterium]MBU0968751.1 family 10 glycosylhydrolase [Pseudomonadota bacterium]
MSLLCCTASFAGTRTAAWVIRFDVDSEKKIDAICTAARKGGFDELLVQVRGRADAFYRSDRAPRPESLADAPPDFDPLARTLAQCAPLSVQAWLNVYYLWGDTTPPKNPAHPGSPGQPWILSDDEGRPLTAYSEFDLKRNWLEGVFADPASPEYRKLFVEVVRELITRYPVSGIHLDFIRYPGPSFGRSGALGREFTQKMGIDPRLLPEHLSRDMIFDWLYGRQAAADRVLTTGALYWKEMRAAQVSVLLHDVRRTIKEYGGGAVTLSTAVFPDPGQAYLENGQDWLSWSADEQIDALYPMAYFGSSQRVGAQLQEVAAGRKKGSRVKMWAGLGAYIKDSRQIAEEAQLAGNNGYDGIALFSLGHLLHGSEPVSAYTDAAKSFTRYASYKSVPL